MIRDSRIERLREKLHEKLNSYDTLSPEVCKISQRLDKLINKHYETEVPYPINSSMKTYYYTSYNHLLNLTKDLSEFPTVKLWDEYAVKNNLLGHISMEFISGMNWNNLRDYILLEIDKKIF